MLGEERGGGGGGGGGAKRGRKPQAEPPPDVSRVDVEEVGGRSLNAGARSARSFYGPSVNGLSPG